MEVENYQNDTPRNHPAPPHPLKYPHTAHTPQKEDSYVHSLIHTLDRMITHRFQPWWKSQLPFPKAQNAWEPRKVPVAADQIVHSNPRGSSATKEQGETDLDLYSLQIYQVYMYYMIAELRVVHVIDFWLFCKL